MSEKLKITIDKKGFEEYCKGLNKSKEGKKIIDKLVKEKVIRVVG